MNANAGSAIVWLTIIATVASADVTVSKQAMPSASPKTADRSNQKALPSYTQLDDEVGKLLRDEARAESESQRLLQALRIVQLAKRLSSDPRFATSQALHETRGRLHARLRTIKKRVLAHQRRKKRLPSQIELDHQVLAQLGQALNAPVGNANNNVLAQDYGPALVELIQRTISPAAWDVNGGASTIRYWRLGRALVIRAPQSVHADSTSLIRQLRRQ